jgi:hypothetical protein
MKIKVHKTHRNTKKRWEKSIVRNWPIRREKKHKKRMGEYGRTGI